MKIGYLVCAFIFIGLEPSSFSAENPCKLRKSDHAGFIAWCKNKVTSSNCTLIVSCAHCWALCIELNEKLT